MSSAVVLLQYFEPNTNSVYCCFVCHKPLFNQITVLNGSRKSSLMEHIGLSSQCDLNVEKFFFFQHPLKSKVLGVSVHQYARISIMSNTNVHSMATGR